ncbi:MAG: ankyrin repeat domain-containing protein [Alphaproteobacteria bacterium]
MMKSLFVVAAILSCIFLQSATAQTPPSPNDIAGYRGLHEAAYRGDTTAIRRLASVGADLEARDNAGRTPLHVAAFASQDGATRALEQAGADLNALENQAYDIVTIAAVANDLEMLDLALSLGANAGNVTSPFDGTALIAAAHLGHDQVVVRLIEGGAPLDHINNLGWTALIEAVILGDGGSDHIRTVEALVTSGADKSIADRQGTTPLQHASNRLFSEMVQIMTRAN